VDPAGRYAGVISPPLVPNEIAAKFLKLYRANESI